MMKAAADETKADEFVKFFVMFLLVSVFVPNKGGRSLAAKYLYMVFDMNKVCWPQVFHDYLLESIIDCDGDVENVVGCVIYPLYWVAEMTMIAKRKDGLDRYPRFARWNLGNVCQQILENFDGFSHKKDLYSELTTVGNNGFSEEDKAVLAKYDAEVGFQPSLKTYSRRKRKRVQVDLLQKEDVRSEPEKVSDVEVVKGAAAEDEMMHIAGKHLLHEGTEQDHLLHEGT
ncbi:hypothetical protein C5167_050460 [Papaver somniferum]|uniref:Uncharacterized protein n=1 Tax=Papaver somniferum TaxID=3469 RepID=A0A4Y7KQ41_PAPSO|nr:hypothetical protein C5167_050460 [Papaver somniferum]